MKLTKSYRVLIDGDPSFIDRRRRDLKAVLRKTKIIDSKEVPQDVCEREEIERLFVTTIELLVRRLMKEIWISMMLLLLIQT